MPGVNTYDFTKLVYRHTQSTPASTWSVTHSLGQTYVSVIVVVDNKVVVPVEIFYVDENNLTISFGSDLKSGTAVITG